MKKFTDFIKIRSLDFAPKGEYTYYRNRAKKEEYSYWEKEVTILEKYKGSNVLHKFMCNKCYEVFNTTPYNIMNEYALCLCKKRWWFYIVKLDSSYIKFGISRIPKSRVKDYGVNSEVIYLEQHDNAEMIEYRIKIHFNTRKETVHIEHLKYIMETLNEMDERGGRTTKG